MIQKKTENSYLDVCELLVNQAEFQPDALAVFDENHPLTFRELVSFSKGVAQLVSAQGLGTKVLINIRQGSMAYAAMFGTLMAGGIYSPVNVDAPQTRNRLILNAFLPDIILTDSDITSATMSLPEQTEVVRIDKLQAVHTPFSIVKCRLAYVIFTSGSTGIPKGVVISRDSLNHYINWSMKALSMNPGDRCSQHPNIAFDLSVIDIYTSICSGATLYPIFKPIHRLMPARAVLDYKLTTWISVPSVIDLMIKASQANSKHLQSLKRIFFCGEPLLKEHLKALFEVNSKLDIINAYGPTEATVSCTELHLRKDNFEQHCEQSVAIGHSILGMEYSLVGGSNGNEGEIVLSGKQLAEGYWNAPEQTSEVFKVTSNGKRKYHTGDWARKKEGDVYFMHRIDRQIKIDGYRIELGEIDHFIREKTRNSVRSISVKNEIHSFIETTSSFKIGKLLSFLQMKIPKYSIPKKIHIIAKLPRNANDKIDDNALLNLITNA